MEDKGLIKLATEAQALQRELGTVGEHSERGKQICKKLLEFEATLDIAPRPERHPISRLALCASKAMRGLPMAAVD